MASGTKALLAGVIGIAVGAVGLGLVRLAALPPHEHVHYHANWALWMNGERVDLSADRYMEDVALCMAAGSTMTGPGRVHLHENNQDIVHVHDDGVTWGHLIQNLGWAIGDTWVMTDQQVLHQSGDGTTLTWILNGFVVPPAHERLIEPGDRLLVSYGPEHAERLAAERFPTVLSNAPEFDENFDPAGCAGNEPETFGSRLRRAFWY